MGSRLTCFGLLVVGFWLLVGCGSKPVEPVVPATNAADASQTSEKPSMKEPKLEINPDYKGN